MMAKSKDDVFVSTIYGGPQDQQNPAGYQVMRRVGKRAENVGKEFKVDELDKAEAFAKKYGQIEGARKMIREGLKGEEDLASMVSPRMRDQATQHFKEGLKRYEKSDEKIRNKEAYDFAGYKKGGKVSSASKRADGCAIRGKTRGKFV